MKFHVNANTFNKIVKSDSIVDILELMGLDSSLDSRTRIAKILGVGFDYDDGMFFERIPYSGTAQQNQLLKRAVMDNIIVS